MLVCGGEMEERCCRAAVDGSATGAWKEETPDPAGPLWELQQSSPPSASDLSVLVSSSCWDREILGGASDF